MKKEKEWWDQLHDAVLVSLDVKWSAGNVTLCFQSYDPPSFSIVAEDFDSLQCPRRCPWGTSIYVNEADLCQELAQGRKRLRIEMQSGDVIVVDAKDFMCEGAPTTNSSGI
jgi:hypothetical protein